MTRNFLLFLLLVPSLVSGITANFKYAVFHAPEKGPYLETYIAFDGADLRYVTAGQAFQASVEVTLIFEQDSKVISFVKTLVLSPYTNDTIRELRDFIDLQRFSLPAGEYELNLRLADVNNLLDTVVSEQHITIQDIGKTVVFSDVVLAEKIEPTTAENTYSRFGYDVFPKISTFYPPSSTSVAFYTELYNANKMLGDEGGYLINIDLINISTGDELPEYHLTKRMTAKLTEPILQTMNIESLMTGEYLLRLEARNKLNELMATKALEIKRFSIDPPADSLPDEVIAKTFVSKLSIDSLRNMCYCLKYKGNSYEENYIEKNWEKGDTLELKRFFYSFWQSRNPVDPRLEWARYQSFIAVVQDEFGTSTNHGCATDRGRVYLKYGKPESRMVITNEPGAYPYEIWHFPKTPQKGNAKFVFYDPARTNDFRLLHSNILGETSDYNWHTKLAYPMGNVPTNDELMDPYLNPKANNVGFRALEYFNNPR